MNDERFVIVEKANDEVFAVFYDVAKKHDLTRDEIIYILACGLITFYEDSLPAGSRARQILDLLLTLTTDTERTDP